MFTPKGTQYFPVENEYYLPLDMPKLEPFKKPFQSIINGNEDVVPRRFTTTPR